MQRQLIAAQQRAGQRELFPAGFAGRQDKRFLIIRDQHKADHILVFRLLAVETQPDFFQQFVDHLRSFTFQNVSGRKGIKIFNRLSVGGRTVRQRTDRHKNHQKG